MKIEILSTGSKGNCAIITNADGTSKLMIDCGLKFKTIIANKAFGSFHDYDALLITHRHTDHSLSRKDFENAGMEILAPDSEHYKGGTNTIESHHWYIVRFDVIHDVPCNGYLILDKIDDKSLWWATDFSDFKKFIRGATAYAIEVNYSQKIIDEYVEHTPTEDIDFNHLSKTMNTHFSLEEVIETFGELPEKPNTLIALHGSEMFSNPQSTLDSLTGLAENVYVAKPNTVINI